MHPGFLHSRGLRRPSHWPGLTGRREGTGCGRRGGRGAGRPRGRARGLRGAGPAAGGPSLVRVLQQQIHGLRQVVHVPVSPHVGVVLVAGPGGAGPAVSGAQPLPRQTPASSRRVPAPCPRPLLGLRALRPASLSAEGTRPPGHEGSARKGRRLWAGGHRPPGPGLTAGASARRPGRARPGRSRGAGRPRRGFPWTLARPGRSPGGRSWPVYRRFQPEAPRQPEPPHGARQLFPVR